MGSTRVVAILRALEDPALDCEEFIGVRMLMEGVTA